METKIKSKANLTQGQTDKTKFHTSIVKLNPLKGRTWNLISPTGTPTGPQMTFTRFKWHEAPNSRERGLLVHIKQQSSNQVPERKGSEQRITITEN